MDIVITQTKEQQEWADARAADLMTSVTKLIAIREREAKVIALYEIARMERCVKAMRILYKELTKMQTSDLSVVAEAATACMTLVADAGWCGVQAVKAVKETIDAG